MKNLELKAVCIGGALEMGGCWDEDMEVPLTWLAKDSTMWATQNKIQDIRDQCDALLNQLQATEDGE